MAKVRSTGQRVAYLAVGVILLIGGITGISMPDGLALTKIGAGIAIVAGLVFLRMAVVGWRQQRSAGGQPQT